MHVCTVPNDDNRRGPAEAMMDAMGAANVNTVSLFKVESTPPVLNGQTTYTTVMSAGLGLFHTTVRTH